jgi:membrane fusion protein, multidrug efflux system
MNRILLFLIFPIFLSVGLSSCKSGQSDKNQESKKQNVIRFVEGFIVKPTVLDQSIIVSGTLKSYEETILMPDVAGRVILINLPEGKFVTKGTLLVKLFDLDLQANLRKLQSQLALAEQTEKRQAELLGVSGISQLDYDLTSLQVKVIKDDIEILKVQIGKTEVRAPFDGNIGLRNISVGAQVTQNTPLATMREINILKLDFSVPEKYSNEITEGKKVKFSIQSEDTSFEARIIAAEGGIETTTRNLKVRAVVDSKSLSLTPGSFAKIELPLGINPAALMIPTQAVIPQERDKKVIVARNGIAQFVVVKTGVRKAAEVEITDGLKSGDTVVTTGVLFIKTKSALKFSKIR